MPLRSTPVVLIPDPEMRPVVAAGLARAGGHPEALAIDLTERASASWTTELRGAARPEAVLLSAPVDAMEAIVIGGIEAGALGGRLVLTVSVRLSSGPDAATIELLRDARVPEASVAVPSIRDDHERRTLWGALGSAVDGRHHLVDVDGAPALAELADVGPVVEGDLRWLLGAGAAGVLAGRMVAGNRRWSPADDD